VTVAIPPLSPPVSTSPLPWPSNSSVSSSLHYPPISITFLDAFDRGQCEVEATIHAAHRVNRICFHLMQHDEPFEDQSTPHLEAERARR
jgi:hypothetical protein